MYAVFSTDFSSVEVEHLGQCTGVPAPKPDRASVALGRHCDWSRGSFAKTRRISKVQFESSVSRGEAQAAQQAILHSAKMQITALR